MTSNFKVHNVKISLKLRTPYSSYCNEVISQNEKIKHKKFGNFLIVYHDFTYILFNTVNDILHCNVTKIKKYNGIHLSKVQLRKLFPQLSILSTKVDNICGTKNMRNNIKLETLFQDLVNHTSNEFKVSYNSQKFPGLFIKFQGNLLTGTLIVFKSGKINSVGLKRPNNFLELDKWINEWICYV